MNPKKEESLIKHRLKFARDSFIHEKVVQETKELTFEDVYAFSYIFIIIHGVTYSQINFVIASEMIFNLLIAAHVT